MRYLLDAALVTYETIGQRQPYSATDARLIQMIEQNTTENQDVEIQDIIKTALAKTSDQLNFTASNNEIDPNKLVATKTAHCVGYASFFTTTCNYLIHKNNFEDTWIAKIQVGQLYLWGENLHQYFHTPFFKDHDFVTIENKKSGKIFAVDPTVNDYLCIEFITFGNNKP